MREDHKPGDLNAQISFVHGMGETQIWPILTITCATSGLTLELELRPEQLAEMMGGRSAYVPAGKVSGFQGIRKWGKYSQHVTRTVRQEFGDSRTEDPKVLPHVAPVLREMQADGWEVGTPRRNNQGQWVLIGRKYVDKLPGSSTPGE